MLLACVFLLLAVALHIRRRKTGPAFWTLGFISLALFAWYGAVTIPFVALEHERVETAVLAKYFPQGDISVQLTDRQNLAILGDYLASGRIHPGQFIVPEDYRLHLRFADGRESTYRLTVDGGVAQDVSATTIQDLFVPTKQGLAPFLEALIVRPSPKEVTIPK